MSRAVKELMTKELARRLSGLTDALLVNVIGLDANKTVELRRILRQQNIQLVVVRNSLARRATEGTPLAPAFDQAEGSLAVVWGGDDFVTLAKQIIRLSDDDKFAAFTTRGGVMEGERLTPQRVKEISTWPSRQDQLSILVGQILSPGARLCGALLGPAAALASQIQKKADQSDPSPKTSPQSAEGG